MTPSVLAVLGLIVTAVGAAASAKGVLITNSTADELSGTNWDQNLKLRDSLIKQSRWAAIGLGLIALGTLVQIVAILLVMNF